MKTILFSLFVLVANCVFANPVDLKTASLVAENYYNSNAKVKANDLSLTYQEITSTGDTAIYYVFNINQSDGWIIIAATDASYPVLGYSPTGNYSKQDQPPAFIYWMEGYKNQILDIIRRRISPSTEINAEWATYKSLKGGSSNKSPLTVGPLLSTTWNQGQYYNAWCPGGCPTGCVATAMAQIMKYWNYPAIGNGDHCYQHPAYGQICANFGNTTYNWSAMPNNVTSSNTAVATLMYHCGVSVNMDYCQNGTNQSGAWVLTNDPNGYHPNSAQNAYSAYFGYDQNTIQGKLRVNYTDSYWINNILKPELDASTPRPIQYVGWDVNGQGGHTWVCDGYNSNNYFHMNWGWGGGNDGWFSINNLNPSIYHFDNGQQALIGIKPGSNGDNTMCGNDNCNDAVILTSFTTCQNTLCSVDNATPDNFNVPSCDSYYPSSNILGAGVFFKFLAVSTSHTITVTPTGTLDAIIVVYSGGCYNLIEVPGGCMDTPGGNGVVTILTVNNLTPDVEYTIRVYDYGASNATSGGFNICVTHAGGYTISTQSSPSNGGTTSGGSTYPSGTYISLSANPNTGYTFNNWTENGTVVSTSISYSFTVTANRTLVANFNQNPVNYTVTTQSSPSNGGTTSGGSTYPSGTYISLSANPNTGYTFNNWAENGTVVSTNISYSFTVTANRTLVANFTATSQNTTKPSFAKLYDDLSDLHAFNGIVDFAQSTIDSSYLVGGQYSLTGSSNDGFYFFKVDKNGNLIWSKEIADFNAVIHSIVKSVNGYMISFGINNEAAIMEVNEGGNVLWSKKLDLYIQNFTSTQGGYIGTYSFMNTLNLVKLDFEGNLLWSRIYNYDNPNGEYVYCEKLASDYYGNIYLLGGIQNPNFFSSQNGIIQKVSPDGNPIWCKQISTYDNYADNLTGFVIDNYSNLYFGLWTNDNYGEHSNGYIGKLNSSGALSSLKQLPVSVFPELFSISQTGDVVQAWYARGFQTTILSLNPALDIIDLKTFEYQGLWIAKSTLDQNIMFGGFETVYRLNGYNDIHFNMFKVSMNHNSCIDAQQQTMALTNSSVNVNSIAVSTTNSGITLSDFTVNPIYTTLLDSTLCDDSGVFTSINEKIHDTGSINKFSIFPNPTTGRFTLKAFNLEGDKYWLEIIDGTGRTGQRLTMNTVDGHIYQTIDVEDLPDGIYMLRISSSGYNQSLKLIVR